MSIQKLIEIRIFNVFRKISYEASCFMAGILSICLKIQEISYIYISLVIETLFKFGK